MKRLSLAALLTALFITLAYGQTQWVADVTVSWQKAQFADGYVVTLTDENNISVETDVGDTSQYTYVGLPAGVIYTSSVRAYNAFVNSGESNAASINLRVPGKPTDHKVISIEGRKL